MSKFLDLTGLQSVVDKIRDKFAPKSHASTATTYGVGTASNYGHVKVINNLTTSTASNGNALQAYQGYLLQQNKADKSEIPTATSQLINDSGFLTSHQDISGKEDKSNKTTSVSSSSTNTQYPGAKAVFDSLSITNVGSISLVDGTLPTELMIANERYYKITGKFYLNGVEDHVFENAIVYVYWGGTEDCVITAIAGAGMVLYGSETTITKQLIHSNGSWKVAQSKYITSGNTDLTEGTSPLPDNSLYFVYE